MYGQSTPGNCTVEVDKKIRHVMVIQNAAEQLPLSWARQLILSDSYLTDAQHELVRKKYGANGAQWYINGTINS